MPPPTRSTRQSSRTSSPFTIATRNSPAPPVKEPVRERKQTSLQEWVEPPPAAPQPSFMDHHFDRTSIFQDMQPLGAMPSSKLKQRIRDSYARKATAGEAANPSALDEERESLEATPATDPRRSEPRKQEEPAPQPEVQEEEVHELQKPTEIEVKQPERIQRLKITNVNGTNPSPSASHTSRRPVLLPSSRAMNHFFGGDASSSQHTTPSPPRAPLQMSLTHIWNRDTADAALAAATRRAEEIGGKASQISKLALMEAFRMADVDPKLHAAIAALGSGTATQEQERRYKNYIKRSKVRLRKELEKGELRFTNISLAAPGVDNAQASNSSSSRVRLSLTPGLGNPATSISPRVNETRPTSNTTTPLNAPSSPIKRENSSIQPVAMGSATMISQPSTPKTGEKTPRSQNTPNGATARVNGIQSPNKQGSEHSSDGNLSEVDETLIRKVENEKLLENLLDAPSDEDGTKRSRRAKDKRVVKGQQLRNNNGKKRRDHEAERVTAEEEQRRDDQRFAFKQRYLDEEAPNLNRNYEISNIRSLPTPPVNSPPKVEDDPPAASTRSRRQQQAQTASQEAQQSSPLQLNGGRKRTAEELDDSSSSLSDWGSNLEYSAPGSPVLPPPSKKKKTAAKTKISPVKNRNGAVAAGLRMGGGRGTPLANDDNRRASDDEHEDTCTACGGEGLLLCCDGCDAAYHFQCCDPPLSEDSKELQTAWYCPKCRRSPRKERSPSPREHDSVWGEMSEVVHNLAGKNFQLPKSIQNYFEDNSVGPDGDYVTGLATYTRVSHARDGPEEHPDYYRLVDKKEKPILCCHCLQGVGHENVRRPIIQCDKPTCLAYWHLDCLDPPLANPPVRGWQKGYQKTRLQWLCPRHAEHDYRELQNPAFGGPVGQAAAALVPGTITHRMRIPRKPNLIDYHRGMRTAGRIHIVNHEDEDEDTLRFYEEEDMDGNVVRMPEDDIKFDFIAKVKAERMLRQPQGPNKRAKLSHLDPTFQRRSFNDQRAALSLAQLAERQNEVDLNADGVAKLVYALTAQADGEWDDGDVAPSFVIDPNDRKQRLQLIQIRRLIDMALASGRGRPAHFESLPNGITTSGALNSPNPQTQTGLLPAFTEKESSARDAPFEKRSHLDVASDAIEVRSEAGLEPRTRFSSGIDEREAHSAPNSRPSSRRETRRTSRRSAANFK